MTTYHLRAGSLQHYATLARERDLPRHHGFDSWLRRGEKVRLLRLRRRAHPRYGEYLYSEWEFRWHGGEDRFALPLGLLLSDLPALKRKVLRSPDEPAEPSPKKISGKP
jgi:hypothetical protein